MFHVTDMKQKFSLAPTSLVDLLSVLKKIRLDGQIFVLNMEA